MSDITAVRGNIQEVRDRLGQSYLSPATAMWTTCILYRKQHPAAAWGYGGDQSGGMLTLDRPAEDLGLCA